MEIKNILENSAIYFEKTKKIIMKNKPKSSVMVQFFQRGTDSVLCGMNEVLELLRKNTPFTKYKIKYIPEGTIIQPNEVVLELEGEYEFFGQYEGIIDGILARQTSIATNAKNINEAAQDKAVIFMGDRADHYRNQSGDGYAAFIGGISTQVTKAQIMQHAGVAIGTMPHALIQMYDGDVVAATEAYMLMHPQDNLISLVDFNNDVIKDSLKALKKFGTKLSGVRVDTAANMIDKYFENKEKEYGVTPNLIKALRKELDLNDGKHVQIIVSSGINVAKIKEFEKQNTPINSYGVGGSILKVNLSFTADAVMINGKKLAKQGRTYSINKKLLTYK